MFVGGTENVFLVTHFDIFFKTACDRVMTKAKGSITSPNWPNPYGANQMCTTTIVAAPGKTIKLKFKKFVLDGAEPSCLTDSVSVRNSTIIYIFIILCFVTVERSSIFDLRQGVFDQQSMSSSPGHDTL